MSYLPVIAVTAGLGLLLVIINHMRTRNSKPFPPGPPGIPILGNLLQIPTKKSCVEFQKWSREYGDSSDGLIGLHLGPWSKTIILNKDRQVRDLLESRGTVYAGRGPVAVMDSMRSWKPSGVPFVGNFAFSQYDDELKRARKASLEYMLRSGQVEKLLPIQDAESTQLVWELLNLEDEGAAAPGSYSLSFYRMFGAVVLAAVYGIRGKDSAPESPLGMFASLAEEFIPLLALTSAPPLDIFPFIAYLPDIVNPWRGWVEKGKKFTLKWHHFWTEFHRLGLETAGRKTSREGDGMLKRLDGKGFSESEILTFGSTMMNGGADTTAVTCLSMITAFVKYRGLQDQARAEVDGVFGEGTMPSVERLSELRFLKACFYEVSQLIPRVMTCEKK